MKQTLLRRVIATAHTICACAVATLFWASASSEPAWYWLRSGMAWLLGVLPPGDDVFNPNRGPFQATGPRPWSLNELLSQPHYLALSLTIMLVISWVPYAGLSLGLAWLLAGKKIGTVYPATREWLCIWGTAAITSIFALLTVAYSAHASDIKNSCYARPVRPLGYSTYGAAAVLLGAFALLIAWITWCMLDYRAKGAKAALRCPGCGYDLQGLADNRCPECGQRGSAATKRPSIPLAQRLSLTALAIVGTALLFAPYGLTLGARLIGSNWTGDIQRAADTPMLRSVADFLGGYP